MKKWLSFMLALVLAGTMLVGCGEEKELSSEELNYEFSFEKPKEPTINWDNMNSDDEDSDETEENSQGDSSQEDSNTVKTVESRDLVTGVNKLQDENLRYVMIYNPGVYDEEDILHNVSLSTGELGVQVAVDDNRASEEEEEVESLTMSQGDMNDGIPMDEFDLSGSKAGGVSAAYQVGDTKTFYCYDQVSTDNPRISAYFTCRYVGSYCNIWTAGSEMDDVAIEMYGKEFDQNVYTKVVKTFGEPRYADQGGKVNLLYYAMPENLAGCFCLLDLYATGEVTEKQIQTYGVNTDMAIMHINANYAVIPEMEMVMKATMAHEFQHLICGTNYFYTMDYRYCQTWLNEAMSGYIEERVYPGAKQAGTHLDEFYDSFLVSHGWSLYNFMTTPTDIGVYGSVYLYSEYLANLAGEDVFSNVHDYWRNSYSTTLDEAEALYNAVPKEIQQGIDQSIAYPNELIFEDDEEEWMSKLTLNFYIELLQYDEGEPEVFKQGDVRRLLYDEINAAALEGGGRIIVELKEDTFEIPMDADKGLIYVGFDENFEVTTDFVYR